MTPSSNGQQYRRLTPEEILRKIEKMKRGRLKVYVGAAPGVGKTYAMLREANELKEKGVDIVIGLIEPHGREETAKQVSQLEVLPQKKIHYKGINLEELDVEGILLRNPEVVIIDELAHTNVPGTKNRKRYQDIHDILQAGIHVWTAMNIQHLESVRDIVLKVTGVGINERVPDAVLSEADEIKLVDVSPETLRERLQEGLIYTSDKIEQALNHFFKKGNLVALRELALREVADDIDEQLVKERIGEGIDEPAGVLERILVCVQYRPNAGKLIRRGWRLANRLGAKLVVLHICPRSSVGNESEETVEEWRNLTHQFDGDFVLREAGARRVAQVIVDVCQEHHITQIIMGQSARTRWEEIWKGSIINWIMQRLQTVDIHIVSDR
ncbi:two-component system, OmpR family, sensor histidine kinase KdpD [Marininema mesophilum]|uniref:Two-component system, OmpR family, sensor histidine kinase KdpD n=1 Tax=Marininema mesophilum TaxID=1048340 RepID=A0A1H2TQU7_9BACL|nr:KdpD-like non-kinase potassium sensor [Marininema mesophilum]SDW46175.1 two-component system, OmpR family, sensor histidine kinase KdpD [Marininema mesophilum]